MKTYKAKGIVLHTVKYGDNSFVAYVLTDVSGRQNYMIHGIKSNGKTNKLALFQPMFPIEFEGMESNRMQLHRMRDVRLSMPLKSIPFDVRKSTIAIFMAEVLYNLVKESERNTQLFDFVESSVAKLDEMDSGIANFHLWFMVSLSGLLGFYPLNDYCDGYFFNIAEGRFSPSLSSGTLMLDAQNARLLHDIMNCNIEDLVSLQLSHKSRNTFLNAMLLYLGYHFDAVNRIKSVKIFSELF